MARVRVSALLAIVLAASSVHAASHKVTLSQALAMPSTSSSASVTVIVSFYKRAEIVERMLDAIRTQSKCPDETWAYVSGSPVQRHIVTQLTQYAAKHPAFNMSVFDIGRSLGYHGRFQIALQVKTDYVVVFDDDCIPGRLWLANSLHIAGLGVADGVFGIKGHGSRPLAPEGETNGAQGPLGKTTTLQEVDVVGGAWLMRADIVKLLFWRKPFTWTTGEDIQLCSAVRMVHNMSCYVLPADYDAPDTMGVSADYLAISEKGDTTGTHVSLDTRFGQEAQLFAAGDPRWGWRAHFGSRAVFVVVTDTVADLKRIASTTSTVKARLVRAGIEPTMVGVSLDAPTDGNTSVVVAAASVDHVFQLAVGMDYAVHATTHAASETFIRMSSLLDMLQPKAVVSWGMMVPAHAAGVGMATLLTHKCHVAVIDPALHHRRLMRVSTRVLSLRSPDVVERVATNVAACARLL